MSGTVRVAVLALAVMLGLALGGASEAAAPNAADLEAEIVCPVCKTTLNQSNAEIAQRMKGYIRQRIAEGASARQIKAELVDQFGPAVIAEPAKKGFDLLAWVLPIGGGVLGVLVVGGIALSWARRGRSEAMAEQGEPVLDAALSLRVDAALEEFED